MKQAIETIREELKTITRKDWIIGASLVVGYLLMLMMCWLITRVGT